MDDKQLNQWLGKFPVCQRSKQAILDKIYDLQIALDTNIEGQITRSLSVNSIERREYVYSEINSIIESLNDTVVKIQGFVECYGRLSDNELLDAIEKYNREPNQSTGEAYLVCADKIVRSHKNAIINNDKEI